MKKKSTLLVLFGTASSALAIAVFVPAISAGKGRIGFGTSECASGHHVGNHYLANDPTCMDAGNSEFWACCECHRQYTSNPGGTFEDLGAYAGPALADSHVAYVAPTGSHSYANHAVVSEGTASIFYSCGVCGDAQGDALATMPAKVNATFHFDTEARSSGSQWSYNAETGVYTSTNKGVGSSSNFLDIVIDTAGVISFDYTSSGEKGYDYLYFGPTTSENDAYVKCKSARDTSGSYSRDVEVGDKIIFVFRKDSGGNAGDDCATVKFVEGEFTYNALTLDTNGGDAMTPMFIENGKIVGDVATPTKLGYYFEGWFEDSGFVTPVTSSSTFSGDATIYAKWSSPLTVTLNANGGTCDASVSFQAGTTPVIPEPTRDGYYFLGWYTDSDFDDAYVSGNKTESFELYAKWLDASSAHALYGSYGGFKFKPNSTSAPTDSYCELSVDVDGSYSLRKYYAGFDTGSFGDVSGGTVTASSNGTVQVFDNGNIVVMHEGSSFATSSYVYVLFKGSASTKSGTTGSSVKSYDKASFVQFTYKSETVTMMVDNTTGLAAYDVSIVKSTGAAVTYANLGKASEDAMYFEVKDSADSVIKSFGYATSTSTLYDTFAGVKGTFTSADSKSITFSGNGKAFASFVNSSGVATVEASGENTYVVSSGTTYYVVVVNTSDSSFTYSVANCSVTFDANEGSFADSSSTKVVDIAMGPWFDPNAKVEEPTREGYTFNGWWRSTSTKGETWVQVKTTTETFTAHWLKNVTVSFADVDDSAIAGCDSIGVVEGSKPSALPSPTKDGYCFMGWFVDKSFETEFTTSSVVGAADFTVYAKWEAAVALTIHYGEAEPLVVQCVPGVAPEFDVSKPGYAIDGYYAEATFDTPVDLSSGITANTTVYVKYTNLTAFVGHYVGYNAYSSTKNQVKTGAALYASYQSVINEDLSCTGKFAYSDAGCSIIGAANGYLVMQKKSEVVYGAYCVADDGTVFVCSHYNGFRNPCTLSGKDLQFSMSTGSSFDTSVSLSFTDGETNHWVFTCIKGTKTYTVDVNLSTGAMSVTSVVDSAA